MWHDILSEHRGILYASENIWHQKGKNLGQNGQEGSKNNKFSWKSLIRNKKCFTQSAAHLTELNCFFFLVPS